MIVLIAGWKGGVGKTTVSLNLAHEWFRRGEKTLLVDLDPQASALTWSEIASEQELDGPDTVGMGENIGKQLPRMAEGYDRVIIDSAPREARRMGAALLAADLVLLPCGPGHLDAWAMSDTLRMVEDARALREDLDVRVLINRKTQTTVGKGAREALASSGLALLEAELGLRVAYQEAPGAGQGVTSYAPSTAAAREVRSLVNEVDTILEGIRHAA